MPHTGRQLLDAETAGAYFVGLRGAWLIREYFVAFYTAHVPTLPTTPERLLGCVVAFWQLVEQAGLPLRWPTDQCGDIAREDTPEETLVSYNWVSEEWMSDLGYGLMTPRPRYYGLGVQGMLDERSDLPDALTLTLWQLFQHTRWAVGVAPSTLADHLDMEVRARILRLTPLAADTPISTLALHLALPEAERLAAELAVTDPIEARLRATRLLLSYAFAQTGNILADHDDYEVEAIHMGEIDEAHEWSNLPALTQLAHEAQAVADAYGRWRWRVVRHPEQEIPRLGGALRRAARAAEQDNDEQARPLIALFGGSEDQADDDAQVAAYAERIVAL